MEVKQLHSHCHPLINSLCCPNGNTLPLFLCYVHFNRHVRHMSNKNRPFQYLDGNSLTKSNPRPVHENNTFDKKYNRVHLRRYKTNHSRSAGSETRPTGMPTVERRSKPRREWICHSNDVIMSAMASQITSRAIVYQSVYSGADQRKHQSSASLAFVRGIHRWPVNSPHKGPVTRKMFPFDDVIMYIYFADQN